jgi:hypothetical protein
LADFNGDGKLDLLETTSTGTKMRFGRGDGTFGDPVFFTISPVPPGRAIAADFDGDGKMDVAFGTTVFFGNGDGTFTRYARYRTDRVMSVDVADLDGNGSPDLIATNSEADDIDIFLTRTTTAPVTSSTLVLTADKPSSQYGEAVTFTATVTGGAIPISGAVTFSIDGRPTAMVVLDGNSKAAFQTGFVLGTHYVTATYTGDENYGDRTPFTGRIRVTQSTIPSAPTTTSRDTSGPEERR